MARRHRQRSRDHLRAEACIPTGKPCPSKKPRGHTKRGKARTLSCNRCCQGHTAVVDGVTMCACQPDTMPCTTTTECCAGVCTNGSCVANPSPPSPPSPPPPPPRCPAGQTLCPDDGCRDCCSDCAGRVCGSDGCDGTCGTCPGSGPGGCGVTCCEGVCCPPGPGAINQVCFQDECCAPQCEAFACGPGNVAEKCGLTWCGTCPPGSVCVNGVCNSGCTPASCPVSGCGQCLVRPDGTTVCRTTGAGAGTGTCQSDADCCPGFICAAIPGSFGSRFVCYFAPICEP